MKQNTILLSFVFVGFLLLSSCKKEDKLNPNTAFNSDGTPKRTVKGDIRDSVYFYSETAYLWYKNLPSALDFDPFKYSTPEGVIEAVRNYSDKGADGINLDKWSFVMDKGDWNAVASGNSKNFGAYYRFAGNGDFYIRQVFANSDMGKQGVERGWKVISVAGMTPKNNDSFISPFLNAIDQNTIEMILEKPDKSQQSYTFSQTDYQTNTIQSTKIFEEDGKKIGYFCFTDFLGDDTAAGLEGVFANFQSKGVNELIIDLRYNGGGYVSLAQQLLNLVAPSSATGKVMFTYQYNDKLTSINRSTKFSPINKLGLTKVVIITTKNSASASELLINSLKPHMDVKIVGTPSHGKPVGFPVIPVMDYVVAPVAFKTVNSAGEADYYTGFKPDFPEEDDLTKNFGDPNEKCLKVALEYLKTGKVITNSTKSARINASINMETWNDKLPKTFDGMFEADTKVGESIKRILNK